MFVSVLTPLSFLSYPINTPDTIHQYSLFRRTSSTDSRNPCLLGQHRVGCVPTMDLRFSPARRRIFWDKSKKVDLVQHDHELYVTERRCLIGAGYRKIEYVQDLVRADMRKWLRGLSIRNLRYLLSQHGDWPEDDVESFRTTRSHRTGHQRVCR